MADFENATPEARRAERDRQRRMALALPRNNEVQIFLANLANLLLDGQDKTQDALLALVDTDEAAAAANDRGAAILRLALAELTDMFGRIVMAARFDCAIVNEAMVHEELIPGVAPAVRPPTGRRTVAPERPPPPPQPPLPDSPAGHSTIPSSSSNSRLLRPLHRPLPRRSPPLNRLPPPPPGRIPGRFFPATPATREVTGRTRAAATLRTSAPISPVSPPWSTPLS
jgi:hypothetical protein